MRLAVWLHALREHGLVEALDIIDLDVEEEASLPGRKLCLGLPILRMNVTKNQLT